MQVIHGVHRKIEIYHVVHPSRNVQAPAFEFEKIRVLGLKGVDNEQGSMQRYIQCRPQAKIAPMAVQHLTSMYENIQHDSQQFYTKVH